MFLGLKTFRMHMAFLRDHYSVVSLDRLVGMIRSEEEVKPHAIAISLDDGYRSVYELALPVLREFEIPATVFLATDFIENGHHLMTNRIAYSLMTTSCTRLTLDVGSPLELDLSDTGQRLRSARLLKGTVKSMPWDAVEDLVLQLEERTSASLSATSQVPDVFRPLTWNQIREMQKTGLISVGSHTHTHAILSRVAPDRIRFELSESKRLIEDRCGVTTRLFCYPNGRSEDFSPEVIEALKSEGYVCGLTTVRGDNERQADPYKLRRRSAPARNSKAAFSLAVSGFTDSVR
jgi:peptidoglycan/xylan/chitin deacetylase (PgdA/CDA1 family)